MNYNSYIVIHGLICYITMPALSRGHRASKILLAYVKKREWAFLTNHGLVLAYLAKHPRATAREVAQKVGVTERTVQKVITDLEAGGYVVRHREGRGNRYTVHPELPMRHRMEREYAVGSLLLALGCNLEKLAQQLKAASTAQ